MPFSTTIDLEKCNGCEECLENCSADVFEMQEMKAVVAYPDRCVGCGACVEVCEKNAIYLEETHPDLSKQCAELLKSIL